MQIRTFESTTNDAVVSMSGFLETYESNIRNAVVPANQLPIYLTDYSIRTEEDKGRVEFSTVALVPTNVFSKRVWHLEVQGGFHTGTEVMDIGIEFSLGLDNIANQFVIGFEGPLTGTFVSNSKVLDASSYWTYTYANDTKSLTLRFTNSSQSPVDTTSDSPTPFSLQISIQNIVFTDCRSQSVPYPPDNIRNIYCIHNSDPSGAFGGFAVSGEVVYRDYGQNFRLTPTFQGSRYKLLFTLTYTDPPAAPTRGDAFLGSIFDLQYVGGGMGGNAYITFENRTQERVCVWVNPTVYPNDPQEIQSYSFVDPGQNTVAYTTFWSSVFRWFDGQLEPCTPITSGSM